MVLPDCAGLLQRTFPAAHFGLPAAFCPHRILVVHRYCGTYHPFCLGRNATVLRPFPACNATRLRARYTRATAHLPYDAPTYLRCNSPLPACAFAGLSFVSVSGMTPLFCLPLAAYTTLTALRGLPPAHTCFSVAFIPRTYLPGCCNVAGTVVCSNW